jgi:hypothetical protein
MSKMISASPSKVASFADQLGNLVNGLAPQVGTLVSKILRRTAEAGAESETDTQMLSTTLQHAPEFTVGLKKIGYPSDTQSITSHIQNAIDALKALPIASNDDQADSDKSDTDKTVRHTPKTR